MDLEKYKKAWKNQPKDTQKVSKVDIYKMAHSKSTSVVKWIFIIGILEILFWISLTFILQTENYKKITAAYNLESYLNYYSIIHYLLIAVFLILFYKNYKSISISDSTKELVNKIIRTRKVVKYYVNYNIISYIVASIVLYTIFLSDINTFKEQFAKGAVIENNVVFWVIMIGVQITLIAVFSLLLFLFYKILYGRLLKKLHNNHRELSSLDSLN